MTPNEKAVYTVMYPPNCQACYGEPSNWMGAGMRDLINTHPSLPDEFVGYCFGSDTKCDYCKRVSPIKNKILSNP